MKSTNVPNIHVLFEHISRFITAAPTDPLKEVNWAELRQLHDTATESLVHLKNMTLPPEIVKGDPSCPGSRPKQ